MERLANLIGRTIAAEPARVQNPGFRCLDAPLPVKGTEPASAAYETEVFNFLFAQREQLGISDVWKCRSVRIDGLLELADGQRLALEIKYRMNWGKACQAGHQFSWFRDHPEAGSRD